MKSFLLKKISCIWFISWLISDLHFSLSRDRPCILLTQPTFKDTEPLTDRMNKLNRLLIKQVFLQIALFYQGSHRAGRPAASCALHGINCSPFLKLGILTIYRYINNLAVLPRRLRARNGLENVLLRNPKSGWIISELCLFRYCKQWHLLYDQSDPPF